MPRAAKPLTDVRIRSTKPGDKEVRLYDGDGLYLSVMPSGARWWRMKYTFAGRERRIGLGRYPDVSLAAAREQREWARAQLRADVDPGQQRRDEAASTNVAAANTFAAVAREWIDRKQGKGGREVAAVTIAKNRWLLETYAIPTFGQRPISKITSREVLQALRKAESAGKLETAQRLKIKCGQVFRYAILTGRAESDPTVALRGAIKAPHVKHHAAITDPKRIGELLRAIDGYSGQPATAAALKLAPLLFVRPGELRGARWSEFDLDASEWRIPAERMKMRSQHIVPLSKQAVEILRDLRPLVGSSALVFPSVRTIRKSISENTLNAALRGLGFAGDEMTSHGFRSMASTRLNELGWSVDAIERQLAHTERDGVRAAYNHAQYLPERRKMMQAWGDYLDRLKNGAEVVPIKRSKARA